MTHPENPLAPQTLSQTAPPSAASAASDPLSRLLANEDPRANALVPVQPSTAPAREEPLLALEFIDPALDSLQKAPRSRPRNGKIARLPKPHRDMVNRMLANHVGYHRIIDALSELGFQVTHRNISNWKTRGGYKEWSAAQARALQLRNFQDNLTDFLRRHDAAELSEVGLQSAATTVSAILLRPDLLRELMNAPEKYSKLIDLQCRLGRELHTLQKNRDEVSKLVGGNPERHKRETEKEVENMRESYSYTVLPKSAYDPGVQTRNFIPKELEPVKSLTVAPGQNPFADLLGAIRNRSSSTTPPQTAH